MTVTREPIRMALDVWERLYADVVARKAPASSLIVHAGMPIVVDDTLPPGTVEMPKPAPSCDFVVANTVHAYVQAGDAGWYVVEPVPFSGDRIVYGPILAIEMAYELTEELYARRQAMVRQAVEHLRASSLRNAAR